jgi:hypothetical protein
MILMNVFQTIQKHKKQGMGIREIRIQSNGA